MSEPSKCSASVTTLPMFDVTAEAVDDKVLAAAGALDQADLLGCGADQRRELRADLDGQRVATPPLAAEFPGFDVSVHGSSSGDRNRVYERAVQIGLASWNGEGSAVGEHTLRRLNRRRRRQLHGAGEPFSTGKTHGVSVYL